MPHLSIEYSSNLGGLADMEAVTRLAHAALLSTGLFEVGAIRVRAVECNAYAIADCLPENAFVDMSLRMGAGRSQEDKRRVGETLYGAVLAHFQPLLQEPHFALSFEIREIDPAFSWKTNAMHARLRGL